MDPETLRGKKIILFRTDRLGDLILSFPVVEALKACLPETQVDMVVSPATASLARAHRDVSRVFPDIYGGPRGLVALVQVLFGSGYQLCLHLFPRPSQSLASFLARIPERAGSAYRYYSPLYNNRVKMHRKHMDRHELELNLQFLRSLGIPVGSVSPGLFPTAKGCSDVGGFLLRFGLSLPRDRFVIIHAGSGGSSLNWPPEHFGILAGRLVAFGIPVVLTGTEADRDVVEHVHASSGRRALNLCGRLDMEHLAALASFSSLVVSNSTGPLHLADALGKRVIGIFSRHFYSSPRRWGPYGQPENVFRPPGDPCPRCARERCREYNCMAAIRPEQVLERALDLLGG